MSHHSPSKKKALRLISALWELKKKPTSTNRLLPNQPHQSSMPIHFLPFYASDIFVNPPTSNKVSIHAR